MTPIIDVTTATHINVGGTWHRIHGGATLTNAHLQHGETQQTFGPCIRFQAANGTETITAPITHVWAIRHRTPKETP